MGYGFGIINLCTSIDYLKKVFKSRSTHRNTHNSYFLFISRCWRWVQRSNIQQTIINFLETNNFPKSSSVIVGVYNVIHFI